MNDTRFDRILGRFAGQAGHFDFAESIKREVWFPYFLTGAFEGVDRGLQRPASYKSLLTVIQNDLRSRLAGNIESGPPGDILAKIKYRISALLSDVHGFEGIDHLDRFGHLCGQFSAGTFTNNGRLPAGVIKRRGIPSSVLAACVIHHTHAELVPIDGAIGSFP